MLFTIAILIAISTLVCVLPVFATPVQPVITEHYINIDTGYSLASLYHNPAQIGKPFTTAARAFDGYEYIGYKLGSYSDMGEMIYSDTVNISYVTGPVVIEFYYKKTTYFVPPDYVIMRIDERYAAIDGQKVKIHETEPLTPIFNDVGRTMIPFRFIAACFGGEVDWDGDRGCVIVKTEKRDYRSLVMYIGQTTAYLNGIPVEMNAPAQIMTDGRTFVPFRAVAELLGVNVEYDFDTMTIIASEGEINIAKCVADYDAIIAG